MFVLDLYIAEIYIYIHIIVYLETKYNQRDSSKVKVSKALSLYTVFYPSTESRIIHKHRTKSKQ